jgi:hypothetical protein
MQLLFDVAHGEAALGKKWHSACHHQAVAGRRGEGVRKLTLRVWLAGLAARQECARMCCTAVLF